MEFGNAPLSIAKLIKLPADRILSRDRERVAESTVRETDSQIGLKVLFNLGRLTETRQCVLLLCHLRYRS